MADPSPPELHARAVELGFTKTKYAAVERERRWLCDRIPAERVIWKEAITDLYITGVRLRLREARPLDGGEPIRRLTKKADLAADRRLVTTLYLSQAEFELFRNLPGKTLRKTRHHLGRGPDAHAIMVDRFEGALDGLLLAEVEFPSDEAMASYSPPDFALAEVTFDARYGGGELVRNGVPPEGLPPITGL